MILLGSFEQHFAVRFTCGQNSLSCGALDVKRPAPRYQQQIIWCTVPCLFFQNQMVHAWRRTRLFVHTNVDGSRMNTGQTCPLLLCFVVVCHCTYVYIVCLVSGSAQKLRT